MEEAWVADRLLRRALARGQRRQREKGLDGGARRISASQRPVEQRLVRRLVERLPARRVDAFDEEIGVVTGLGHEGQDVAGGGIDRDQRAAPITEGGFRDLLQLDVERQPQVVAGDRRRARKRAHRPACGIDFDFLDAGRAVQLAFVGQLDPDLADVVGALVVRRLLPAGDALDIAIVDAAYVAQHMRRHVAERILAEQARLDVDAGETVAVDREARHFLVGQPGTQRQAFEVLGLVEQLAEASAIARLHVHDRGEFIDRRVEILDLRRHEFQRVTGVALRQHHAVAVGDDAAVGRDRHDRNAIRLGQRAVMLMLEHLQVHETAEQSGECEEGECGGDEETPAEQEELALRVAHLGRTETTAATEATVASSEQAAASHRLQIRR